MTFVGIEKKTKALVRLQGVRLKVNVPSFIEKNVAFGFDSEAKLFKLEVKKNKKTDMSLYKCAKKDVNRMTQGYIYATQGTNLIRECYGIKQTSVELDTELVNENTIIIKGVKKK